MKLLVLVIRSLTLMNVISLRQNEHLRGTKSSESLASSGFLVTCQMAYSVVKKRKQRKYVQMLEILFDTVIKM